MSRRLASPEAETRSYWPPPPPPPVRISATISFDVFASLRLILQPVCCSNFFAKLGSLYAAHSIRLSFASVLAVGGGSRVPSEAPAAGTHSATAAAATRTWLLRIPLTTLVPPCR